MKSNLINQLTGFEGEGTAAEIEYVRARQSDPLFNKYTHVCVDCFAAEEGIEKAEAERLIKAPRTSGHILRSLRWEYAKANVQAFFKFDEAGSMDKDGIMTKRVRAAILVTIDEMKNFFNPMLKILAAKAMDEEVALDAAKKYQAWVQENPGSDDAERGVMVDRQLDEAMNKWRSFHSKGEEQAAFCRAADYADEWFGNLEEKLRVYYVCKSGGTEWPCNTLISSKEWRTLHDDPMATKQRWYCKECNARYATRFGVVCELQMGDGKLRYCQAELPPQGIMDAKFMSIEGIAGAVQTPQELYDKIATVSPLACVSTIQQTQNKGYYKFVGEMTMDGLPKMEWEQLYNLVDFKPIIPVKKEK
jgi:hypothetical protein